MQRPPNLVSLSVQRAVKIQELLVEAQVPLILDTQTMLTGASSKEAQLTFNYLVFKQDGQASISSIALKLALEPYVQRAVCGDQNLWHIVTGGGLVTFSYLLAESRDEFSITVNDCSF